MFRFLIVDDTPADAAVLRRCIDRYANAEGFDVSVSWFASAEELLTSRARFDLVFLDIAMLGTNGMEAAHLLRTFDPDTPLVFVTNLAQYAIKGYEVNAFDYILKPLSYQDFRHHMARIVRMLRSREVRSLTISAIEGTRVIPYRDLERIEVRGHTVTYHLAGGDVVRASGTLSKLEEEMAGGPFVRISNNDLVNMDCIRGLRGGEVVMESGTHVAFSRPRKAKALERITDYLGGSI